MSSESIMSPCGCSRDATRYHSNGAEKYDHWMVWLGGLGWAEGDEEAGAVVEGRIRNPLPGHGRWLAKSASEGAHGMLETPKQKAVILGELNIA